MGASWVRGASFVAFAYFLGSIPFGLVVARLFDRSVDLRAVGSGNIGATNVARAVGKAAGLLTVVLDAGKAVFAMALASAFLEDRPDLWLSLVALAALLGHLFPVYLNFRGGKGVATALGIVVFLSPVAAAVLVTLFALIVFFTRYVSLGSLAAALALPPLIALLNGSRPYVALSLAMALLVFLAHRENIRRLVAGRERKFGAPGPEDSAEHRRG